MKRNVEFRKGIETIVLERSENLRATGAAIIVQPNGWRALDQLGIASKLRQTALSIQSGRYITVKDGKQKDLPVGDVGELRCLKRTDLLNALAENLPADTVRLGCKVVSIKLDPSTSYPILQLQDGSVLMAKVVIGCDGVNSTIANILGLNSTRLFSTNSKVSKSQTLIKESTVEAMKGFPIHIMEMVKDSDLDSLHLTDLRFLAPWDLLGKNLRRGTVTVAGDAMHAMAPFLAQGGSASLEDAVVLARCLSQNQTMRVDEKQAKTMMDMEAALDQFVKERKMRVFWLSLETFLIGTMLDTSTLLVKCLCIISLMVLFRDKIAHTRYDCGLL
ncbi:FAD-binding domain - like 6 [Theobroma cacao]|nr:FAD-binding domain - like 6 [Theobroma cacao]